MDKGSPRADLHIGDWVECCLADRHGHHKLRGEVVEISQPASSSGFVTSLEQYRQLARRLHIAADVSDDTLLRAARREGVLLELDEAAQLRVGLERLQSGVAA